MKQKLPAYKLLVFISFLFSANALFAQPVITSFSPLQGNVGSSVVLTGKNFSTTATNNIVYFGATKAAVTIASSTSLTVTVPSGATYDYITVTIGGLTGYSNKPFDIHVSGAASSSSFKAHSDFASSSYPLMTIIGDLNLDGKPDVVVTNYTAENTVSVYVNNTATTGGSVSLAARQNFTTGTSPAGVAIGDVDGDGKPDMVVVNNNASSVSVLRNITTSSTPSFAAKADFSVGALPFNVAINDFDGDGKPDLAVNNQNDNTVSVLRNNGSIGNISFAAQITLATGNVPNDITVADMDGDGKPDIIVPNNSDNTVSVFLNKSTSGNISFATQQVVSAGNFPATVKTGDIDGDGKLDIIIANGGNNTISILRNMSTGSGNISFAPETTAPTGPVPYNAIITDINGDGKPDVVTSDNNSPGAVSVLLNKSSVGNISFATNTDYATPNNSAWAAAGDLNADGLPDVVTVNLSNISVLQNNIPVTPLPVTLLDFTGQYQQPNKTVLLWQTTSENNAGYFEIQRSSDAINFIPVGKIDAIGSSTNIHTYNYTDQLDTISSKVLYYRLKEVDDNGAYSFSNNIVSVSISSSNSTYTLSPNPAVNTIHITGNTAIKKISIIDITGRICLSQEIAATYNPSVNISALISGLYFVEVTDVNGKIQKLKLLVK